VSATVFVLTLYLLWTAAWLLERTLEPRLPWLATSLGSFVYWTAMKAAVWIAPSVALIRHQGRKLTLDVSSRALRWGGAIGLLTGLMAITARLIGHHPLFHATFGWAALNAVVVAPIVEEIAFRGALLPALLERYRFAVANTLTALLFVGAHLPGWYFQGRLRAMLTTPLGGALSIFILGLLFGWVAWRSKTVAGSILAHALNNFVNL
jgi:membrane protease YdiL (CAAX protease family)